MSLQYFPHNNKPGISAHLNFRRLLVTPSSLSLLDQVRVCCFNIYSFATRTRLETLTPIQFRLCQFWKKILHAILNSLLAFLVIWLQVKICYDTAIF